jgi:hypothetical protein
MSRRPYFKFYFEDFLHGCRKAAMTPEEVGMYIMQLGFIWEDEGATSADPSLIGVRTGWGKRLSTRLIQHLIAKKKLAVTADGRLTNARMEHEIGTFVAVKKAALAREESKRKSVFSPTIEPLEIDYRETTNDLFSKKNNQINVHDSTDEAYTRSQKPEPDITPSVFQTDGSNIKNKIIPPPREPSVREGGIEKSSRAPSLNKRWQVPEDRLDGSQGILFEGGKLSVFNGTATGLAKDFPELDLQAVCNKAAAKIAQMKDPTHLQALTVIRQYCQYSREDTSRRSTPSRAAPSAAGMLAGLSPKYRERLEKGGK